MTTYRRDAKQYIADKIKPVEFHDFSQNRPTTTTPKPETIVNPKPETSHEQTPKNSPHVKWLTSHLKNPSARWESENGRTCQVSGDVGLIVDQNFHDGDIPISLPEGDYSIVAGTLDGSEHDNQIGGLLSSSVTAEELPHLLSNATRLGSYDYEYDGLAMTQGGEAIFQVPIPETGSATIYRLEKDGNVVGVILDKAGVRNGIPYLYEKLKDLPVELDFYYDESDKSVEIYVDETDEAAVVRFTSPDDLMTKADVLATILQEAEPFDYVDLIANVDTKDLESELQDLESGKQLSH